MSVRVVARIRPLLKSELDKDVIVEAVPSADSPSDASTIVRMPNPRNEAEAFSFQFNRVYDHVATQQQLFDEEGKQACTRLLDICSFNLQSLPLSSISSKAWMSRYLPMESLEPVRLTPCEEERHWQNEESFHDC